MKLKVLHGKIITLYRGILLQIDDPVDSLMNSATPIEKKCARFAPVDAIQLVNHFKMNSVFAPE